MTPQKLKNSILQLAIAGKLVEQRAEEGTAEELLLRLNIDYTLDGRKVKKKVIDDYTEDDYPFDIPSSWKWVKMGNICLIARGGSPRPIKAFLTNDENGINWIKIGDTDKNGKYIHSAAEKITEEGTKKSRFVHAGDFLLTNSMSFGRPYILKIDGCIHDGWLVISQKEKVLDEDFLYYVLSSTFAYNQFAGKVSGAVVKNLNSDKVANSFLPLPPLAEQKRIVAKIEQLLPYIDRYEKAWSRLQEFNKRFPSDMQKSLLQYAIEGKLVEQRAEEGTAEELFAQIQAEKQRLVAEGKLKKQKPLPEITEEEKPFDIPESWKWVRLGEVCIFENGDRSKKYPVESDYVKFGIPFFGAKDIVGKYLSFDNVRFISSEKFNELGNGKLRNQDFICLLRGSVGKCAIFKEKNDIRTGFICAQMVILRSINLDLCNYLYNYFISPVYDALIKGKITGTAVRQLAAKDLANMIFPLPPLAEQKRIVARLEELLPLCDRLKK